MPFRDLVIVNVDLAPRASARASLGIGNIIHTLTDDQDDKFPNGARVVQIFEASWETQLDDLGIVDGEAAYEDVRAHFSQPRKPEYCWLTRRGDPQGTQVKTLTIADGGGGNAIDGTYSLQDIEGGAYTVVASGNTFTEVRDSLLALVTAGTHPTFTEAGSGANAIEFTAANVGQNVPMTLVAPEGGATLATTTAAKQVKRKMIRTLTFPTGDNGAYEVIVETSTGQKTYQWTEASGSGTGNDQAAAFKVLFDADPSDLVTSPLAAVVGNVVTLEAANAGTPFDMSANTPNADAAIATTQTNYNISDDIRLAILATTDWYVLINGSHLAIDLLQAAETIESERKLHLVQSSDSDITTAVDTDVFSKLQAAARQRTAGVYHPTNSEGVISAWAGDVTTDGPGAVNWSAIPLAGFTGQLFPDQSIAANTRNKEGAYLERFERRNEDIMIGGYAFDGRPFDLRRALDTFCMNVEFALFDLLVRQRVVPYTAEGIARAEAEILAEWDRAVSAGYGVSLDLQTPEITDATAQEQERGILPAFTGHAVMQVGTFQLRADFTVSQVQEPEALAA